MSYRIESYDSRTGEVRVTYSSTEEIVSTRSFYVPQTFGKGMSDEALEQAIQNMAPVWHLWDASAQMGSTQPYPSVTLGEFARPLGIKASLDDYKLAKLAQIRAFRDVVLASSFSYRGYSFSADPISITRLNSLALLLLTRQVDTAKVSWPTRDGQHIEVARDDVLAMLQNLMQRGTEICLKAAAKEREAISARDAEELAKVEWLEDGVMGGVFKGNYIVTSGPRHQTYETEIAVDRVEVQ